VLEAESHFSRQILWTRPCVPIHSQGDMRFSLVSSVDKNVKHSIHFMNLYSLQEFDNTGYHSFMNITVFWDVTSYSLALCYQCFGRIYCLNLHLFQPCLNLHLFQPSRCRQHSSETMRLHTFTSKNTLILTLNLTNPSGRTRPWGLLSL
jgi:hypothetical protein